MVRIRVARQGTYVVCLVACAALFTVNPARAGSPPTEKEVADSPVYSPAPEYPERALRADTEGSVTLTLTIAPDGRVTNAVVVTANPEGWFEKAALEAVKKWKYRPPKREITREVTIDFTLPDIYR
jgi:protein TonB